MKKVIKNAIITLADCWELTPAEVLECIMQAAAFVAVTTLSIRPICWVIVKIAELVGRI